MATTVRCAEHTRECPRASRKMWYLVLSEMRRTSIVFLSVATPHDCMGLESCLGVLCVVLCLPQCVLGAERAKRSVGECAQYISTANQAHSLGNPHHQHGRCRLCIAFGFVAIEKELFQATPPHSEELTQLSPKMDSNTGTKEWGLNP